MCTADASPSWTVRKSSRFYRKWQQLSLSGQHSTQQHSGICVGTLCKVWNIIHGDEIEFHWTTIMFFLSWRYWFVLPFRIASRLDIGPLLPFD